METTIYYFTSTGNSLETARLIGQKLSNTTLVSMQSAVQNEEVICGTECIGLIYPVYFFGLPLIVRRFAEKLRAAKPNSYVFAVATCAGSSGFANLQLRGILQKNGLDLSAGFTIKMPGNYTPMYGAPGHKTMRKLVDKAGSKAQRIAEQISRQEKIPVRGGSLARAVGQLFYRNSAKTIPTLAKHFTVRDTCKSCGICERVCPVANIYLQNGKPCWLQRCEHCLACLQWCPVNAIQWGKKTAGRRRYHHPSINIRDIEQSKL